MVVTDNVIPNNAPVGGPGDNALRSEIYILNCVSLSGVTKCCYVNHVMDKESLLDIGIWLPSRGYTTLSSLLTNVPISLWL